MPELPIAGEHLLGLLASSLASRSARKRIPCLRPLLSRRTEPPEAHRRKSSTGLDLRRCLFSFTVFYTEDYVRVSNSTIPLFSALDLPSP
jgi:hypothetical protein